MYLTTTPWWLRKLYSPSLTWKVPAGQNEIFLTFDDGPHPEITPFVLDCLHTYNARATFFCVGKNVLKYPAVYRRILDEGHKAGNHTHNHLNGWNAGDKEYLDDVMLARKYIDSNLFRPPYGRISRFQVQQLKNFFTIIMWNVLSGDFDVELSSEKCLQNVVSNVKAGAIIVFHDSEKAFPRLEHVLPKVLEFMANKGFKMQAMK